MIKISVAGWMEENKWENNGNYLWLRMNCICFHSCEKKTFFIFVILWQTEITKSLQTSKFDNFFFIWKRIKKTLTRQKLQNDDVFISIADFYQVNCVCYHFSTVFVLKHFLFCSNAIGIPLQLSTFSCLWWLQPLRFNANL